MPGHSGDTDGDIPGTRRSIDESALSRRTERLTAGEGLAFTRQEPATEHRQLCQAAGAGLRPLSGGENAPVHRSGDAGGQFGDLGFARRCELGNDSYNANDDYRLCRDLSGSELWRLAPDVRTRGLQRWRVRVYAREGTARGHTRFLTIKQF